MDAFEHFTQATQSEHIKILIADGELLSIPKGLISSASSHLAVEIERYGGKWQAFVLRIQLTRC